MRIVVCSASGLSRTDMVAALAKTARKMLAMAPEERIRHGRRDNAEGVGLGEAGGVLPGFELEFRPRTQE